MSINRKDLATLLREIANGLDPVRVPDLPLIGDDEPWTVLPLKGRTYGTLAREAEAINLRTVRDLRGLSDAQLLGLNGFGRVSLQNVHHVLGRKHKCGCYQCVPTERLLNG